jgi:hypothetical protein
MWQCKRAVSRLSPKIGAISAVAVVILASGVLPNAGFSFKDGQMPEIGVVVWTITDSNESCSVSQLKALNE